MPKRYLYSGKAAEQNNATPNHLRFFDKNYPFLQIIFRQNKQNVFPTRLVSETLLIFAVKLS